MLIHILSEPQEPCVRKYRTLSQCAINIFNRVNNEKKTFDPQLGLVFSHKRFFPLTAGRSPWKGELLSSAVNTHSAADQSSWVFTAQQHANVQEWGRNMTEDLQFLGRGHMFQDHQCTGAKLLFYYIRYNCAYRCVSVQVIHTWVQYLQGPKEGIGSPRAVVMDSCELPSEGSGNWTQVLFENCIHS